MPETPNESPRTIVLADSDSRWKWGALTARRLIPESEPQGFLLRGRATPSARQLAETGAATTGAPAETTLVDFIHRFGRPPGAGTAGGTATGEAGPDAVAAPGTVIVLACVGHTIQAALHGLARAARAGGPRPVVVTGYVGVVYEKLAQGLMTRHGADLVLANSPRDAELFREIYRGAGADDEAVVTCPLPFLGGTPYDADAVGRGDRPHRVVFAVQPSVPETRAERLYLLNRAAGHARRRPEREVLIKLRSRPGEHTTHIEALPYQRLLNRLDDRPTNLHLRYGPMAEVLDGTDLLVTVSSTAALEAMSRSIPTAVLTDLGIREPLGNHWFLGSGCLTSWDRIDADDLPAPDPAWLVSRGVRPTDPDDPTEGWGEARARLTGLLDRARDLAPGAPYYTVRTAPGHLPGLLARHGLDPEGAPLPGRAAPAGGPLIRVVRGPARGAARGVYRLAAQRVAPMIRRWGQL
ncbi:DUF6716 putative glycosyltransferase [Streptomyces sp. ST2-7A]|uniref:DUF6716 putative glycosyltransferase n=1 Tax=Streptomyces sp. ST2-7A TaxID=2907214 RepID=UPI001F22AD4D|nr:DUF6716 putative glycosyltransferase [Streptomyces sp. ST2-7A]MCE7078635.1 hypothetical protein [Streptomyces sp. ST2-7A]